MSIIGRSFRSIICRVFRSANEAAFAEAIKDFDLPYTKEDISWLNEMYCNIVFIQDNGWEKSRALFWRSLKAFWCAIWYAKTNPALGVAYQFELQLHATSIVSAIRKFAIGDHEAAFKALAV